MLQMQVIELTPVDTVLFTQFRQYQDQFVKLLEAGVFDPYLGHMSIYKDGNDIRQVEYHTVRKF